jgi:iron complex outermembrane recepter protein
MSGKTRRNALQSADKSVRVAGRSSGLSPHGTSASGFAVTGAQADFSSSYDSNSQYDVYFGAINLTDETFNTHGRFKEQVLDVVDFG